MKCPKSSVPKAAQRDRADEVTYPELYRKSEYIKGRNSDVPIPFQIGKKGTESWVAMYVACVCVCVGKIVKITSKKEDVLLTLEMFYR